MNRLLFCLFIYFFSAINTTNAQKATIPTPESFLGHRVGADFKLATYDQSLAYFQKLATVSDNIKMVEIGKTSNGLPWYFALISSEDNLKHVEKYRKIAHRLAHPTGLTDAEAKKLAKEGKPFVHIDGGLHSTEVACGQHVIELAYDLIQKTDDPMIAEILDKTIVMLWPSLNPDGQNMVADWYHSNVGTSYEVAPIPKLYQKYVGHDNNRDAYMNNMIESRVVARTWRHWEPNIIYVHHQSSPFPTRMWLPPFAEPIASQAPPIVSREVNMIGMAIAQALETNGQTGAVHMGKGFDAWYPGYIDYMPVLQNIPAYWTETALYKYATPYFYTMKDFPKNRKDLRIESLYNSPWKGGWWRLRDPVEYMLTASKATLDYAAKYGEVLLYNRYQAGRNTIKKYEEEPPYAYIIPQKQSDPVAAVELLRRLAFNGIRVHQLSQATNIDGINYPTDTWVIPMNQEYAELTKQILDIQNYPDLREYPGGPPEQPYDAAGWTLPLLFDTKIVAAVNPLSKEIRAALKPVEGKIADWATENDADIAKWDSAPDIGFNTSANAAGIVPPKATISGSGNTLVLNPKENNTFKAINQALTKGAAIHHTNGKYIISGLSNPKQLAIDFAVNGELINPKKGAIPVKSRIALYRPHRVSMDEGWTRWVLEQYGFNFTNIGNGDFNAGDLDDRFDVILMASDRPSVITDGYTKGTVPPRYEGGLGAIAISNLDKFIQAGGTLVCLNQSSGFAIDALHLPVKNVTTGLHKKDFFTGGSILEMEINTQHPVMTGMAKHANIFVWRSPVFTTLEGFKGEALAKYSEKGSPLRSGYLLGEEYVQGYAASLDVEHGDGHVILHGFRPQWRGQTFGTFKILFNSVFYTQAVANGASGDSEFWTAPNLDKQE